MPLDLARIPQPCQCTPGAKCCLRNIQLGIISMGPLSGAQPCAPWDPNGTPVPFNPAHIPRDPSRNVLGIPSQGLILMRLPRPCAPHSNGTPKILCHHPNETPITSHPPTQSVPSMSRAVSRGALIRGVTPTGPPRGLPPNLPGPQRMAARCRAGHGRAQLSPGGRCPQPLSR